MPVTLEHCWGSGQNMGTVTIHGRYTYLFQGWMQPEVFILYQFWGSFILNSCCFALMVLLGAVTALLFTLLDASLLIMPKNPHRSQARQFPG